MQNRIIENFISLTKIPHCSQSTDKLLEFLKLFALENGYIVEIDGVDNILIKKENGEPKLALQAHYDMVCMGKAPNIETYEENGWLYAKDSSLGADNGMAVAMMMSLMEKGVDVEFLLTSDEEIGLVGASAIEFELNASYMLNLDFEDEGIVCIGCAGGADLLAQKNFLKTEAYNHNYELRVSGLEGGHSGIEIHKNIPNAIKVLADYLRDKSVKISSCYGGERRNSIPTDMVMNVSSKSPLESSEWVKIRELSEDLEVYDGDDFLNLLITFKHGVITHNDKFDLPDTSINLALVAFENGEAKIECTLRAMSNDALKEMGEMNLKLFEDYGFNTSVEYKYPSWKPETNNFTTLVNAMMIKEFNHSRYEAIHAGLECGVLLSHYPHIKFASIGPTIVSPHSTHEGVKLDSVEKIFKVVERVIDYV